VLDLPSAFKITWEQSGVRIVVAFDLFCLCFGVLLLNICEAGFEVEALINHGFCIGVGHGGEFASVRLNQSHPLVIALVRSASYFRYTGQNILLS
jgi:hypothetical protein